MSKTRRHNKRKIRTRKNRKVKRIKGGDCWKRISEIKNDTLDKEKYIDFLNNTTSKETYGWFDSINGNSLIYRVVNNNENPCVESGKKETIDISERSPYKYRISTKVTTGFSFFNPTKGCTTMPNCIDEPKVKQSLNGNQMKTDSKVSKKTSNPLLTSGLVDVKSIEMARQRQKAIEERARIQAIKDAAVKII